MELLLPTSLLMKTVKYNIFRGTLSLVFGTGFMVSLIVNLLSTLSTYGGPSKNSAKTEKIVSNKMVVVKLCSNRCQFVFACRVQFESYRVKAWV